MLIEPPVSHIMFFEEIFKFCRKMEKNYEKTTRSVPGAGAMAGSAVCAFCADNQDTVPDGIYRGSFTDPKQVEVEFEIKDNAFVSFKFRSLTFRDMNYKENEDAAVQGIAKQFTECTDHLAGKDVSAVMELYTPANVASDVDGFTAATLRSSKLISAIFDGLNRGVYKLAE